MAPVSACTTPYGSHDASSASTGKASKPTSRIKGKVDKEKRVRDKARGSANKRMALPTHGGDQECKCEF
jgi:hypothetical protein